MIRGIVPRYRFRTWLFSIGKHIALMHLRKLRRQAPEETLPEDRSPLPENELLRDERKRALYTALEKLLTDYRQVLTLLHIEEMSPAEVAQILNKRVKQVYNMTDRGKRAWKQELLRMGFASEDI